MLPILISSISHQPTSKYCSSNRLFSVLSYGVKPRFCVRHVEFLISSPGLPEVKAKPASSIDNFVSPWFPINGKLKNEQKYNNDANHPNCWFCLLCKIIGILFYSAWLIFTFSSQPYLKAAIYCGNKFSHKLNSSCCGYFHQYIFFFQTFILFCGFRNKR